MPLLKAALIGIPAVGIGGTGIFIVAKNMKEETIEERLQREKAKILGNNETDTEKWSKKMENSTTDQNLEAFIKKNTGDETSEDQTINVDQLKKACEAVLKKKNQDSDYSEAKKYCTEE